MTPARHASLVVLVAASGCSDGTRKPAPRDAAPEAAPEPTYAPTFSAIYREVIAAHNCLLGLCHGEGASGGGLRLFPRDAAYDELLTVSDNRVCADLGLAAVEPGAPDRSLLFIKLQADPPCGLAMPPDTLVDSRHVEQVRLWIEGGAPED